MIILCKKHSEGDLGGLKTCKSCHRLNAKKYKFTSLIYFFLIALSQFFFYLFAFITFNPCFTAWVCHGVFTVCFLLLIYITYALS